MLEDLTNTRKDLLAKAPMYEIDEVHVQMKRMALYEDFHELVDRIEPQFKAMIQNMEDYYKETANNKALLESFDTTVTTKANKSDLIEINLRLRDIARVCDFEDFKVDVSKRIDYLSGRTDECHSMT